MTHKRKMTLAVFTVLLLVLSGLAKATVKNVSIVDFAFSPAAITVNPGDTVLWTNNGAFMHTTTSNTLIWDSGDLSNGMTFPWQFTSPGSFPYKCSIHFTSMFGTVVVNSPPSLVLPPPQSVLEPGQTDTFTVSATDPNAGDTVNITFLGVHPTPSTTTPVFTGNNPGHFSWTPVCAEAGTYHAVFQANDGKGGITVDSVQVTVTCTIHDVKMIDLKFSPAFDTIGVGEEVCWIHQDSMCMLPCYHTTTSDSGLWSDSMVFGDTFCFVFNSPGTYPYSCTVHKSLGMVGTIQVCAGKPGDANGDNKYSLVDIVAIVNYYFNKAGWPACSFGTSRCWLKDGVLCRGDWNGNGTVTLTDIIQIVNYYFSKPCNGPGTTPACWAPVAIGACCFSP